MNTRVLAGIATVYLFVAGAAWALISPLYIYDHPDRAHDPLHLHVQIDLYQDYTQTSLHIVIHNPSAKMACIDEFTFDVHGGGIVIWDAHDRLVPFLSESALGAKMFHGFYYLGGYSLLPPSKTLDFYRDLKFFRLGPGTYKYGVEIPYYVCRDVIDLEKVLPPRDIEHYSVVLIGHITVKKQR
jgi:hypothetical protein